MCYGCVMMDDPCGLWSQELPVFPPAIPPQERKPIRVLGLFDGIATGELEGGLMERGGGGGRHVGGGGGGGGEVGEKTYHLSIFPSHSRHARHEGFRN